MWRIQYGGSKIADPTKRINCIIYFKNQFLRNRFWGIQEVDHQLFIRFLPIEKSKSAGGLLIMITFFFNYSFNFYK